MKRSLTRGLLLISFLLIFCGVLPFDLIKGINIAYAITYETDKNVDISSYDKFRAATIGKAYDMDGYYGAQCWDGVQLLYKRVGMSLRTRINNENDGYAKYCWLNEKAREANTGDKFIQITDKTKIKRGDIVVFDQFSSAYYTGHIGFADEDWDDSGYIHIFGQNQKPIDVNNGSAFEATTYYTTSKILGAFRYKGWSNPEPERATLDVNFFINGNDIVDISGIGSFTIKIGNDTYTNQTDFCRDIAIGTSYAISNIKASSGYSYTGVSEGSLSGSVGSGRTNIRLNFYNIYTVQYNANGGSGAPSSQTKTHGKTLTLSKTKPKRDHYVFLGWATSKNATSAAYQPGGNYTSNAGTTLYAVWKPEEYAVTYDSNGDNVGNVPASQSKVYGTDLTLSALIPTRIGYTFLGWGTSADATSVSYTAGGSYTENKALKLYAIWQITNPPSLSATDDIIMLVGDRRNWQDFVTLEHDGVLSYSLKASASGDASLKGETIKALSAGKATIEISVTEYPAAKCTVNVQIIDLSRMITLPDDLTEIGSKAFANTKLTAVTIPNGCTTIAAKAFASNKSLVYVYIPNSVESIASDAFAGCKNVAIYCNSGSAAEKFAQSNGLRYYTPSESWVLASDLPAAAKVTADKWTYNLTTTETTTSTKTSMEGYTQTGFTWQKKGSGTWIYANYPGGFDTGHSLYKAYNQSALSASQTETTKREVGSASRKSYIYWHWTFTDNVDEDNRNVLVEDARRTGVNIGGSVYRDFVFFDAFETTKSLSTEGMTTSGLKSYDGMYSTYHHPEYNKAEYASWWWWRFEVYNQTYTDYEKLFSYSRTVVTQKESDQEVVEGAGVSDVQHWVKYTF